MNARPSWYNEERVKQSGSVILTEWKAKREAERAKPVSVGKKLYAGAQINNLTSDWSPINTSGDAELITSLRLLRSRSRQVVRDNEHAKNAVRIVANNVINTGIGMQATVATAGGKLIDRTNTEIETAHEKWADAKSCHTAGKLHFHDIERLALMAVVRDGEVLIRKIRQAFGSNNTIPYALEILEADRLIDTYSSATAPGTGNAIRMGVEVDIWMRPVAYWMYPAHPGDFQWASFQPTKYIRVPAEEIIHLYIIDRWPQTRGEPWFHAALKRLHNAGGYEEAEIVAARASASIMGIITSPETPEPDDVEDGQRLTDLTPGTIQHLRPGEEFTGFSPNRPNAAIDPFMRHMLRAVAAGIGCSYSALTKDYSQANYSSERAAQLEDRVLWRILQGWFIRNFRAEIYREWLEAAVLCGAVKVQDFYTNRKKYESVRFKPPGWSWIDPTKEVMAYKQAVRCGFMSVSDVIGLTGNGADPEDIFKARRSELDLMADLDLIFDTDPAQVDDKGKGQVVEPAAEEENAAAKPNAAEGTESAAGDASGDENLDDEQSAA
jgi:lambda family phage portal protein